VVLTNGRRVVLTGEMDLSVAESIRGQLTRAVDSGADIAVDLSQVAYIDSSCIRELLRAQAAAEMRGSSFVVVEPSDQVRRVLEIADVMSLMRE